MFNYCENCTILNGLQWNLRAEELTLISCVRCRKMVEQKHKLLQRVPEIDRKAFQGICDHCKLKLRCAKCQEAVKKFFSSKENRDNAKERMNTWLSNVKKLLKDAIITKNVGRTGEEKVKAWSEIYLREHDKSLIKQDIKDLYESARPGMSRAISTRKDKEIFSKHFQEREGALSKSDLELYTKSSPYVYKSPGENLVIKRETPPVPFPSHDKLVLPQEKYPIDDDRFTRKSYPSSPKHERLGETIDFKQVFKIKSKSVNVDPLMRRYEDITLPPDFSIQYQHEKEKDSIDSMALGVQNVQRKVKIKKSDRVRLDGMTREEQHVKEKETEQELDDRQMALREKVESYKLRYNRDNVTEKTGNVYKSDTEPEYTSYEKKASIDVDDVRHGLLKRTKFLLKKSHSEDSVLINRYFSFSFPREVKVANKIARQKSSSELIKDTQDMLKIRVELERKKLEEKNRKKGEDEENRQLPRKERAKWVSNKTVEKNKIEAELKVEQDKKTLEESKKEDKSAESKDKPNVPKENLGHKETKVKLKPKSKVKLETEPKEKPSPKPKEKAIPKQTEKLKPEPKEKGKPDPKEKLKQQIKEKPKVKHQEKSKPIPKERPTTETKESKSGKESEKETEVQTKEKEKLDKEENLRQEREAKEKDKQEKERIKKEHEDKLRQENEAKKNEKEKQERLKKEKEDLAQRDKQFKQQLKEAEQKQKELVKKEEERKRLEEKLANEKALEESKIKKDGHLESTKEHDGKAKDTKLKSKHGLDNESNKVTKPDEQEKLNIDKVKVRKDSIDDLILQLVKLKQNQPTNKLRDALKNRNATDIMSQEQIKAHKKGHIYNKKATCPMCICSDLELQYDDTIEDKGKSKIEDIIIGQKIFKYKPSLNEKSEGSDKGVVPLIFRSNFNELPIPEKKEAVLPQQPLSQPPTSGKHTKTGTQKPQQVEPESVKGIIRYALSDRTFIDKGWTMLPTEKVVRKMNVYRMRPAHPEFDWFEHNKNKRLIEYDTGERLAEFDDNGRGRWYYRNGRMALDYYDAEELNAQQRFVIYSNGEPDARGRPQPYTILATFDYLGNGIVFDHGGKIRMKYNQTEGVVLDRNIGPVSTWKWHTLNDPPVLQQVMIDTQLAHKDPDILKMGGQHDKKPRQDNEEMLAIEFDNFIKEKSKKLSQNFKPFQIKMKALKINDYFSLRVLDQASVYLIYRDGTTNLKLNIGMVLDHKEIVDTDTAEVGEVSNNMEKFPAATDSLAELQKSITNTQRFEKVRNERDIRLRRPEPRPSVDKLTAAASRPMRFPLRTVPSGSTSTSATYRYSKCTRKPTPNNFYYDNCLF